MWIADNWNDYEVIDTSSGAKLERWGGFILERPDPQVIWNTPKALKEWRHVNARYHRSSKGGGEWEFFDLPEQWTIQYDIQSLSFRQDISKKTDLSARADNRLTFHLKPFSFKHTGLFPEQAVNWEWFSKIISDAVHSGKRPKVLNLFAYTGGATCAAARAGAHVTHVDASKGMTAWAKENAASSDIDTSLTRWIVDDCVKFVEREIRRGNTYDAIIMDPPSYGRGPKGEVWKIEDNIFDLIGLCSQLLSEDPLFFLINSYTTGLQPAVLTYMLETVIARKYNGSVISDEVGLPVSSNGLVLPCGASGRWQRG